MRRIGASAALIVLGVLLVNGLLRDRGSRVQAAEQQLAKTESALGRAVRENQAVAKEVDAALGDGRTPDLVAFEHSTVRLQRFVAQLEQDKQEFSSARDRTFNALDKELALLHDEASRRGLESLRNDALHSSEDRLRDADLVLSELRVALARAADVSHATKALSLVHSLQTHDAEVARHITEARSTIAQYQQQTTAVLNRLPLPLGS